MPELDNDNKGTVSPQNIIDDLDTLISSKISIDIIIGNIKRLTPYNSGREKSISITKLEEAKHRIQDAIILHKELCNKVK